MVINLVADARTHVSLACPDSLRLSRNTFSVKRVTERPKQLNTLRTGDANLRF